MSWNYRIVERKIEGEKWFEVVEAYYEDGKVTGFTNTTETPVRHMGETVKELIEVYERVLKDLKKSKDDILDENVFDDKRQAIDEKDKVEEDNDKCNRDADEDCGC